MKVSKVIFVGIFVVSSCLAGNYTIQMSSGIYSGFTASLNAPLWDGDPDGLVVFRPTEGNGFLLNSMGNSFRVTTRLGIQVPNPDIFWSNSDLPILSLAGTSLSFGAVGGAITFINQPLYPLIDLRRPNSQELSEGVIIPTGNALDTWLIDEFNLGNISTPGSNISIVTTFESGPVIRGFTGISIGHPGIVPAVLSRGAFVVSEFWIQDLNGESANYLSVIPEPSSLSLLLAGGAVFAAARRRKVD